MLDRLFLLSLHYSVHIYYLLELRKLILNEIDLSTRDYGEIFSHTYTYKEKEMS